LRRLWRIVGWFVVINALITAFGVTTAPLLLLIALDIAAGLLVVRAYVEMRAGLPATLRPAGPGYEEGS
jgi:uncharacterized membrane protein